MFDMEDERAAIIPRTYTTAQPAAVGQCHMVNENGERCVRSNAMVPGKGKHTRHWPRGYNGKTWVR